MPVSGCAQCGWPSDQPTEILSRHTTSEGVVVYSRCVCGALHMWVWSPEAEEAWLVARSRNSAEADLPVLQPAS